MSVGRASLPPNITTVLVAASYAIAGSSSGGGWTLASGKGRFGGIGVGVGVPDGDVEPHPAMSVATKRSRIRRTPHYLRIRAAEVALIFEIRR